MEALVAERPDLSGLPVAMGDACRTKGEQARQFTTAVNTVRQALQPLVDMKSIEIKGDVKNAKEVVFQTTTPATAAAFWERYQAACAQEDKAAPPGDRTRAECVTRARIAALMQMLAPETPVMRLGLAKYLSGISHADATKALARLAIFSAEDGPGQVGPHRPPGTTGRFARRSRPARSDHEEGAGEGDAGGA